MTQNNATTERTPEVVEVPLAAIDFTPAKMGRAKLYESQVKKYAKNVKRWERKCPIDVFTADDVRYFAGDGWHRSEAMLLLDRKTIKAAVVRCESSEEAKLQSTRHALLGEANEGHGKFRTGDDRRECVRNSLLLEPPKSSNREICKRTGVSRVIVDEVRRLMTVAGELAGDARADAPHRRLEDVEIRKGYMLLRSGKIVTKDEHTPPASATVAGGHMTTPKVPPETRQPRVIERESQAQQDAPRPPTDSAGRSYDHNGQTPATAASVAVLAPPEVVVKDDFKRATPPGPLAATFAAKDQFESELAAAFRELRRLLRFAVGEGAVAGWGVGLVGPESSTEANIKDLWNSFTFYLPKAVCPHIDGHGEHFADLPLNSEGRCRVCNGRTWLNGPHLTASVKDQCKSWSDCTSTESVPPLASNSKTTERLIATPAESAEQSATPAPPAPEKPVKRAVYANSLRGVK